MMPSRLSLGIISSFVSLAAMARPWGEAPNGSYWNEKALRFVQAPAFRFADVAGAVSYRSEVLDDFHVVRTLDSTTPVVDLASIWKELPVGYVTVICRGVADGGGPIKESGRRTFWKKEPYSGHYAPQAMSYGLAASKILDCYLAMPQTRYLKETGRIDLSYSLNGYPTKMLSAEINALVDVVKAKKGNANELKELREIACKAADCLIGDAVPAGQPLQYLPRTYAKEGSEYGRFKGEQDNIHFLYPPKAGVAFLKLYGLVKEKKYLEAAERIAETYLGLQESDGTWSLRRDARTGEVLCANRLVPLDAMQFLEMLHDVTGKDVYRACADRAFAFLDNGPMKDWNWEGQFEDSREKIVPYQNHSNFPANMMASYLVRRFPDDPVRIAQAEELLVFVEDQFVEWEPPYGHCRRSVDQGADDGGWRWFCKPAERYNTPCVLEQYICYHPVDASAAKTIQALLDVWQVTKKPVYLEKARALADAQTRMIEPDGFINTWSIKGVDRNDHRHHTWLNCTMEIMSAFERLAEIDAREG